MRSEICARCRPLVASARRQILRSTAQQQQQRRNESTTSSNATGESSEVPEKQAGAKRKVVFSGIQPTGVPHLGNYLGALRQWKQLQDDAQHSGDRLLFSVVDLHAITMPQEATALRLQRREMLAALLAVGLDPDKGSTLFFQSSVPQHAELMWILSCTASMGYLGRMTQWKSKLQMHNKQADLDDAAMNKLKLGLFSYPVLQAADILVHRATHVPVGADQRQHLEFARECATNFNHTFKDILIPPETVTTPSARVMSLTHPHNKMSKSSPNHRSRILITARPEEVRARVAGAVTDSRNAVTYEPDARPGVANLLELLAQCGPSASSSSSSSPQALAERYAAAGATLADLKRDVADAVCRELDGVRDRYDDYLHRKGGKWLDEIEEEGAEAARRNAEKTMRLVRYAVGLGPRP
ncbi:tryptophanyl-tRNA synthetase [Hypoxylon cercidicola]|nr:tryptophanyl-tRNA synthetase [Hypoxylon cercidicola]